MATETFHRNHPVPERSDPARYAAAVTPNDSTDLTWTTRGLYVGGSGNVVVHMAAEGTQITFVGVQAGTILPIAVSRVRSTSTTATNIVALW
jgi:hypothetical protein